MHRRNSQLSITLVALILGILVVVQLRAQNAGSGLENLSATDLTQLVANLNTRNDQLRAELATLQSEDETLRGAEAGGETAIGQLRIDISEVRGWAGLDSLTGPGIDISISGQLPGVAVEDLLNELRNAGAEGISVAGVRAVPGTVVAGNPGALSVENTPIGPSFDVLAIGNAATLQGTLSRTGGIIAQLNATFPSTEVVVTPLDSITIPATSRSLAPAHGSPAL